MYVTNNYHMSKNQTLQWKKFFIEKNLLGKIVK